VVLLLIYFCLDRKDCVVWCRKSCRRMKYIEVFFNINWLIILKEINNQMVFFFDISRSNHSCGLVVTPILALLVSIARVSRSYMYHFYIICYILLGIRMTTRVYKKNTIYEYSHFLFCESYLYGYRINSWIRLRS